MTTDLNLGDRVRVNDSCPYQEFIGTDMTVVGMHYERDGTINIHCSEDWPHDIGSDGWKVSELDTMEYCA